MYYIYTYIHNQVLFCAANSTTLPPSHLHPPFRSPRRPPDSALRATTLQEQRSPETKFPPIITKKFRENPPPKIAKNTVQDSSILGT